MPQMIENHIFPHATHSKHTLPLSSRQTSAAIPRLSGQTRAAAPARAQKAADEFARYLLTRNLADVEYLRFPAFMERKAMSKKGQIEKYEFWGLMLFVGIPLPGTDA